MPEGDTLFRTAAHLHEVLVHRQILAATGKRRYLDASQLVRATIANVSSRGKHLLVQLEDQRVIHSHMGMTGSWHVYQAGDSLRKPAANIALEFQTEGRLRAICFTPKTLELLTATQLRRHAWLSKLGPDMLDPMLNLPEIVRRLRIHNGTPIGEAIMNQTVVCGIGNVYKSEVLFLCGINPSQTVAKLDDETLTGMVQVARELMMKNLEGYPRRTRLGRDGSSKWVYGRAGEPCHKCGTSLRLTRQGDLGRSTYFCGRCQA